MFKIIEEQQNDLDRIKLLNQDTGEYVSIIPQFGANINELVLTKLGNLYSIIDGYLEKVSFEGNGFFKSANLLPFANRIKGGCYTFKESEYQFPIHSNQEDNASHGFIYDKPFMVIEQKLETHFAEVTLRYIYDGSLAGYPFPFELYYIYTLSQLDGFQCQTRFINKSTQSIPFGSGWHPYFTFNKKVDALCLKFTPEKQVILDENMIPNGDICNFNKFHSLKTITTDSYDSCFYLKNGSNCHVTELYNPQENVTIQLWQETGLDKYNYLQIYIPPDRNSIALEPMTSNVNAFNNKDGLIVLEKDQSFEAEYGVKLV